MRVLVLNAGSSSLKASVLDPPRREAHAAETVEWGSDATRVTDRRGAFGELLGALVVGGVPIGSIDAVGHRVVHGGTRFVAAAIVDDEVLTAIEELAPLAPLHNAIAVETIRLAAQELPDVPQVACFDTALHTTLDQAALRYPVPDRWFEEWGVRRFGFHGLSVAWSVRRAAELAEDLDHGSGLVGVAGTSDVRALLAAEAEGEERAALALEIFVRRAAAGIAAMSTELRSLDALVFTGGIGEHAGPLRARIVARLGTIGLSPVSPTGGERDMVLSGGGGSPAVLRIE